MQAQQKAENLVIRSIETGTETTVTTNWCCSFRIRMDPQVHFGYPEKRAEAKAGFDHSDKKATKKSKTIGK